MFVTIDTLYSHNACDIGINWFKKHYPNGVELKDLINHKHITPTFLHWGFENLNSTEEEKELYHKRLDNYNNKSIFRCSKTSNSDIISCSTDIKNCQYIYESKEVIDSQNVIYGEIVENSHEIYHSTFVYNSDHVMESNNINNSSYVVSSTYTINSKNIYLSRTAINCRELRQCENAEDAYFCADCKNIKHCIGCQGLTNCEYYIFNQKVSPEQFELIKKQYLHIELRALQYCNDWPIEMYSIRIPNIDRRFPNHYLNLPERFLNWLATLPNYSNTIMYNITLLPNFLDE